MKKQTITWLAITLLVAAAGSGLWLWQRQQNDDEVAALNDRIEDLRAQTTNQNQAGNNQAQDTQTAPDTTGSAASASAPVVFDPPGSFSAQLQQTLKDKAISPHHHYSLDQNHLVAAYYVSQSQQANEYAITAIFSGGDNEYEGFLVSSNDDLNWTPVCLDQCQFSDEFKATYPEIVERTQ